MTISKAAAVDYRGLKQCAGDHHRHRAADERRGFDAVWIEAVGFQSDPADLSGVGELVIDCDTGASLLERLGVA